MPPEQINFEVGKVYYVKRKNCKKVEPLYCVDLADGHPLAQSYQGTQKTPLEINAKCTDVDIEFVFAGVPEEVLHEANRRLVWGE